MSQAQRWLTTAAGVAMPALIYGTAWKKERTTELVQQAIVAGFKGIDTACQPKHYAEALVGEALARLKSLGIERESLFLQTKFTSLSGQDPESVPYEKSAPLELQVEQSFSASQKNLQTQYLDSLVLHSPLESYQLTMRAWKAMEAIQRSGGARQLGISNCYSIRILRQLYEEASVKPAVLQNRFYAETGYDEDLRLWCSQHKIIYQGFWTLSANSHVLASEFIRKLAQKYDKTEAQIFYRYLTQSGIVPLIGTASKKHMRQDLDIFSFELAVDEVQNVNLLLKNATLQLQRNH